MPNDTINADFNQRLENCHLCSYESFKVGVLPSGDIAMIFCIDGLNYVIPLPQQNAACMRDMIDRAIRIKNN